MQQDTMPVKKLKIKLSLKDLFIILILVLAFILRIYRIGELLDFHYDQGRDALVIWDLWHKGKLFLIGPVTGLPGVFLGPFYYYLIAPFYLIGRGNPVVPSIFLSFLVTVSLYFLYKTGKEIESENTGIIALLITSFSAPFVFSGRWLSNPTPIYLTSIVIFYFLVKIIKSEKIKLIYWLIVYFLVGISLHFESASSAFYLPVIFAFTYWQRKKINWKVFFLSITFLFVTFLPQIIFNFKHGNILINNVINELPKSEPLRIRIIRYVYERFETFWNVFSTKIFPQKEKLLFPFFLISLYGIFKHKKENKTKSIIKLFSMFLAIPAICYIFYRGNYGVLYDYYFTGYYLILILLFSFGLSYIGNRRLGKTIIVIFFILFFSINFRFIKDRFTLDVNAGHDIFIKNQIDAISWIYKDAKDEKFNVDCYVPPVIPFSYNYLFTYLGDKRSENWEQRLYTLYEIDTPHPERLDAWLERQKGIGVVEQETNFGGITVQRRKRI